MFAATLCKQMLNFSTKHVLKDGQYLLPNAPKRPSSSFLLYSLEVRKTLNTKSVTESSKVIGEKWKAITPQEKAIYDEKAKKLREIYEAQKKQYDSKYVEPFKRVNNQSLMMKRFYVGKKFGFAEGVAALKKYRENLTEEEKKKYKIEADEIEKQKQKTRALYRIPSLQYKTYNSFYLAQKKERNLPAKKQLTEAQIKKLESDYQKLVADYEHELKTFALSFHISVPDLKKMLNKSKSRTEIVSEKQGELKKQYSEVKRHSEQAILKAKLKKKQQVEKAVRKAERAKKAELKRIDSQFQSVVKRSTKSLPKLTAELEEAKRIKLEMKNASKKKTEETGKTESPKAAKQQS